MTSSNQIKNCAHTLGSIFPLQVMNNKPEKKIVIESFKHFDKILEMSMPGSQTLFLTAASLE